MKKWIVLAVLASPLLIAGCDDHSRYYGPPPPMAVDGIRQHGYHDGFEAARRDVTQQRRPDVDRHPNFRNPPVPRPAVDDYRRAFRAGYDDFLHHSEPRGDYRQDVPPPPPYR